MLLTRPQQDAGELLGELAGELGLCVRHREAGSPHREAGSPFLALPDGQLAQTWREGYPYGERLGRKHYAAARRRLQIELLKLQRSVKSSQRRLVIVFEGRDAAGKGGTIRRFTENLNPRGARIVALERPTDNERSQWYFQRYIPHLPAPGEIVFFDRSWYNRAGVERVLRFCTPHEHAQFLQEAPDFERMLADDGITLIKFWLSVSRSEQLHRFVRRQADPVKQWKLSPVDLASLRKWDQYTQAKEAMFARTDLVEAPWTVVKSNDKRRARLEAIRHVLSRISYEDADHHLVGAPDTLIVGPPPVPAPGLAPGPPEPAAGQLTRLSVFGALRPAPRGLGSCHPLMAGWPVGVNGAGTGEFRADWQESAGHRG
jgi:polyphosphate kinase 2